MTSGIILFPFLSRFPGHRLIGSPPGGRFSRIVQNGLRHQERKEVSPVWLSLS
jgi:hypothetical protein